MLQRRGHLARVADMKEAPARPLRDRVESPLVVVEPHPERRHLRPQREAPLRQLPERLRGRTRHNKAVNFTGLAAPGELTEVEIVSATSQTLAGEERLLARAWA